MSVRTHAQAKPAAITSPALTSRPTGLLQRKCACGGAAGVTGECEGCTKKRLGLQTKLKVNEPGDVYEQEADRVANLVMAGPAPAGRSGAPLRIQRLAGHPNGQGDMAPASVDHALASPGRPLQPALRVDMEQRFGHDFSRVRVHTGPSAEQSARDVNAHAYTVGHSIVFATGRFAPETHEGRRLIAHELTHVRQQSTGHVAEAVQRQPSGDDWSIFEGTYGGEPRFVFWAKRNGRPPANHGEEMKLLDAYRLVEQKREVLEAYDRALVAKDRDALEARRQATRAEGKRAVEARFELSKKQRARPELRTQLRASIKAAWNERTRHLNSENVQLAKDDAARKLPLAKALRKHWKSDQQRWVYIRQYYREYSTLYPDSLEVDVNNEDGLALYAAFAEESYLEMLAKDAYSTELAQYRTGISIGAKAHIKHLAETRPMNPLDNFEPGIHDYAPYQGQPGSVEEDVGGGDFDAKNITLKYSDGKELEIPLGEKNLLFPGKRLDPTKVLRIFTRRHKKSQRLIPFVIYENTPGVNLDMLSEEDLALLGWPRFDDVLSPGVMYILSPEFKMRKLTLATLKLASLHATGLGLRQLGVPFAAGTLRFGTALVTGTLRTGGALTTAAIKQISLAVAEHGYTRAAVTYLGREAVTFSLLHAPELIVGGLAATDLAINLGGGDTGFISPGDEVSMAVAEVKAGSKAVQKNWQLLEYEVKEVNFVTKQAKLHLRDTAYIAEKTAKVEFDLGKKLVLVPKDRSVSKVLASAPIKPGSRLALAEERLATIRGQAEAARVRLGAAGEKATAADEAAKVADAELALARQEATASRSALKRAEKAYDKAKETKDAPRAGPRADYFAAKNAAEKAETKLTKASTRVTAAKTDQRVAKRAVPVQEAAVGRAERDVAAAQQQRAIEIEADRIRKSPANVEGLRPGWDYERFPAGPRRDWQPGDAINMPDANGNYPVWATVRARIWRNRAADELAARAAGTRVRATVPPRPKGPVDPNAFEEVPKGGLPWLDPIRSASDKELAATARSGSLPGAEIEHARIPQRAGDMLVAAGVKPNMARRVTKVGDPDNLMPTRKDIHAIVDESARVMNPNRNPTLKFSLDVRTQDAPFREATDAEIANIVKAVKDAGIDPSKALARQRLLDALAAEKKLRPSSTWTVPN